MDPKDVEQKLWPGLPHSLTRYHAARCDGPHHAERWQQFLRERQPAALMTERYDPLERRPLSWLYGPSVTAEGPSKALRPIGSIVGVALHRLMRAEGRSGPVV